MKNFYKKYRELIISFFGSLLAFIFIYLIDFDFKNILYDIILAIILIVSIGLAINWYLKNLFKRCVNEYYGASVFAATAFVYLKNSNPIKFLWIKHEIHNDFLPPGGRLMIGEIPHDAIKTRVTSETGIPLEQLAFSTIFHNHYSNHTQGQNEIIQSHPLPIIIQTELVEQRGGIPFHYDFIYVFETEYKGPLIGRQNPNWLDMDALNKEKINDYRFLNSRLLAKELASRITEGKKGPL